MVDNRNFGVDNIVLYQRATNSLFSHECEPTVCKYMYMCMCVHISLVHCDYTHLHVVCMLAASSFKGLVHD